MSHHVQSLKSKIMMALDKLSVDSLELMSEFVILLQNRAKHTPPHPNVIKEAYGSARQKSLLKILLKPDRKCG
jgi:hypothetical protein